jgi:hypothetical protein
VRQYGPVRRIVTAAGAQNPGLLLVKANKWGENRREGMDNGRHVICGMNGRNDNYEYAD